MDVRSGTEQRPQQLDFLRIARGSVHFRACCLVEQECRCPCLGVPVSGTGVEPEQTAQPGILRLELVDELSETFVARFSLPEVTGQSCYVRRKMSTCSLSPPATLCV